ncbi:hypothetical protein CPB86DRAFT_531402 [Serendipita vermifera]|nr:hypothetical protein CPB86DRAFT_531402 [Serendipita vermifera]
MVLVTTTINYIFVLIPILSRNVLAIPFYSPLKHHLRSVLSADPTIKAPSSAPTATGIPQHNPLSVFASFGISSSPVFTPTTPTPFLLTVYPFGSVEPTSFDITTITQAEATVTVTAAPKTTTMTIRVSLEPTPPVSTSYAQASTDTASNVIMTTTPNSSSRQESFPTPTLWSLPARFSSIEEAFGVHHYAYGQSNVELIRSVISSDIDLGQMQDATIIKVLYPKSSYSPSHKPRGGTDFYSIPSLLGGYLLSQDTSSLLTGANNITLSYSVYFPDAFDFVKGGKLPGLYGGHEKCSGGDDAMGCFSTRLMWRRGGKGELYLYAPRHLQTPSLCTTPPQSICDSVYGMSIGRGSFTFRRSEWTHVRQTVWLNTPGQTNGGFILQVGSEDQSTLDTVINSAEVLYRDTTIDSTYYMDSIFFDNTYGEEDELGTKNQREWGRKDRMNVGMAGEPVQVSSRILKQEPWDYRAITHELDLFPPVSGDRILKNPSTAFLVKTDMEPYQGPAVIGDNTPPLFFSEASPEFSPPLVAPPHEGDSAFKATVYAIGGTKTVTVPCFSSVTSTFTQMTSPTATVIRNAQFPGGKTEPFGILTSNESARQETIGFTGIFFSTFFGGSTPDWASPRDQYVLFKDFRLEING